MNDDSGYAFVSYAHADHTYVRRLVTNLTDRHISIWYDQDIPTGERWATELRQRIERCATVVVVMSPTAATSEWVRREIQLAQELDKPVLPLLLAGDVFPELRELQYERVLDGRMPSDAYVAQLPKQAGTADNIVVRTRVRHLLGQLPGAADCFQDRDLVDRFEGALIGAGAAISPQILTGLGGVGKTQLAAAVARRFVRRASLDVLLWVNAGSHDAVLATFAQAGRKICGANSTDAEAAAEVFLEWLANTTAQWLIVLDDVAKPVDLMGLWPPASPSGRVVVTTRRRDAAFSSHGHLVPVGVFTADEAQAYLVAKFGEHPSRLVGAKELAADLGYLPLALSQAAAFVVDQDLSCADYRQRLAEAAHLVSVLPEDDALPDDYRVPVAAALVLSTDAADRTRPAGLARPLLSMLSLLDPNGVPLELVTAPATLAYLASHRTVRTTDLTGPPPARDAVAVLRRFNLVDIVEAPITPAPTGEDARGAAGWIRVHALLQRATREQTPADRTAAAAVASARALLQVWPAVEPDASRAEALRSNVAALRTHAEDTLWSPDARPVLLRAENSLGETGLVAAALAYAGDLFIEAQARLGADDADTLLIRHDMTRWQGLAGDPAGAAAAAGQLYADAVRVLGPDHQDTLRARGSVAIWRGAAGDPAGAATALEELLADQLRVLGADHVSTLTTRNNLARLRAEAGDMAGSVAAFEHLLPDYLRVLGPDHPDTLSVRSEIALWRGELGDPAAATVAYEQLLADQRRVLGPDHPDTRTTRSNIAYTRGQAGDFVGARVAFEELLLDELRLLGPDHPDVLITRQNIGHVIGEASNPAGALATVEPLLADRIRVLGPDHPDTLTTRHDIARWRGETGDAAGAAGAFEQLLTDRLRVLGPDHPGTLLTRRALARWRGEAGDPAGAFAALHELSADLRKALGPNHPNNFAVRRELARWQGELGDTAGAIAALEQLLAELLDIVGPNHPVIELYRRDLDLWRGRARQTTPVPDDRDRPS